MHPVKPTGQSFSSWETKEVVKYACNAADEGDIETLSYCFAALSPKHRSNALTEYLNVSGYGQKLGLEPIDWLERAAEVTGRFSPKTNGKHNLYIILLTGLNGKFPGYGLYVGETSKAPEIRFNEHSQAKRNRKGPLFSRIVHRHCKCLLPTLYSHLNPLSRQEAKDLEGKIAEALRLEGIPVYGGH
jgi:hypothetical protein